jgi:hypothetical protein
VEESGKHLGVAHRSQLVQDPVAEVLPCRGREDDSERLWDEGSVTTLAREQVGGLQVASRGVCEVDSETGELAEKLQLVSAVAVPADSLKEGQNRARKKTGMLRKKCDDQMAKIVLLK